MTTPDMTHAGELADTLNSVPGLSADVVALDDNGHWVISVIDMATRRHTNLAVTPLPDARR